MPVPVIGAEQLTVFLLQASLLLLAALALGKLAVRLGMPAIVGELCAGLLAGPSVLAHVAPRVSAWLLPPQVGQAHLLDAVGQIGVVLLTGLTGMQVDLGLLRYRSGTAVRIGAAGLLVPLALGVWIGLTLPRAFLPAHGHGGRTVFALLLGVALGVSALPVIARILTDMRLLHRDVGQLILCAVTVDDVVGWVLLAVVSALATSTVRPASLALPLGGLLATVAVVVGGRPVMRAALQTASRARDSGRTGDGPLIATVTSMILLAAAATQAVRLEGVIGAFACGLLIRSSGTAESDLSGLAPLNTVVMSMLAPLYFATVGLRMDLSALASPGPLLAGLVVLTAAICGKFAGAYVGGRASRLTHWEALAVGAGINSRGVVEVIVAMTGLQLGVLTQHMYTIVVLVAIVTSLMAPPLLRSWMGRIECSAEELLRADASGLEPAVTRDY